MSLFHLSRIAGTSIAQLDHTYGHLLPDTEENLRGLLDNYDLTTSNATKSDVR